MGYRARHWGVLLELNNLFDAKWREAQFANESQLRQAPYLEAAPVEDVHFTPGNPRNVHLTLSLFY